MSTLNYWNWRSGEPPEADLDAVAGVLRRGGVVMLPTDTIDGLHALADDERAIERIVMIKGREANKPLVVLAADTAQLEALGVEMRDALRQTLGSIWPAPLTAVLPLRDPIAASRGVNSLAVRVPGVSWLRRLLQKTGPLASTSANRSGEEPLTADLPREILEALDGIASGPRIARSASTIIDLTASEPRLLREGEFLFTQNLWKTLRNSL
jgi:L-threonylcarbamoyladenylate synthase